MAKVGKTAIIIGGTHGIGLATAQLLIETGAQVLITGRNQHPIDAAKAQLGDKAYVVKCDITSLSNIEKLVEETKAVFADQIDFIYINAGYALLEPFTAVTEETFNRTMSTNVFGTFFIAQKFSPLVRDGGAIVFTTSVSAKHGISGMATYSASKAAVYSLVQTLAAELAERQIRVNAVSPGFVRTPTMGVSGVTPEELVAFEEEGTKVTPLGRIGAPEEVAKAVIFLAFDATFTTATDFAIDGGLANVQKT
ncbi:hypothetical protein BDW74DRAFT_159382 [Aspergillus multicolor]|uniref:putative short chain dehydrogenase n=1 Tax=Aspergillus multicolor TaxID=41759 RepID=UPI003CCE0B37